MMRTLGSGPAFAVFLTFLMVGCSRPTVEVYDVPKAETATPSMAEQSPQPSSPEDRGWIRWTKPESWTELEPTAFRKGNYVYEDASGSQIEITVSSFPGDVGGTLANVNRWRGQAGLGSLSPEELAASLTDLTVDGYSGQMVDISPDDDDPQAARIAAAIFMYRGESWFFKMSGPQSVVDSQKAVFDAFVRSLEFTDANAARNQETDSSNSSESLALAFDAPEGWTESSGSSFRIASFQIDLDGFEPGDFSITRFPGDAGGLYANVNRWRQQIGLPIWSESQIDTNAKSVLARDLQFSFFDLAPRTEAEKKEVRERILVAVMEHEGQSYFFKLRGEVFLAETQLNKFLQLLRSTRFEPESP